MRKLLILAATLGLVACTDAPGAERALKQAGYSHVEITGYAWFDCEEKEQYATGFKALGPTGVPVEGSVCAGLLKGNTIRLD